jgi:hypothetical protein
LTWETLALWFLGALLVILGSGGVAFGWLLGCWWFHRLFGFDPPKTQLVVNNHPPPGHYIMSTPEGFSIRTAPRKDKGEPS